MLAPPPMEPWPARIVLQTISIQEGALGPFATSVLKRFIEGLEASYSEMVEKARKATSEVEKKTYLGQSEGIEEALFRLNDALRFGTLHPYSPTPKKRVIEVGDEWYYLSPDAPAEIKTREELIRWSLGRGRKGYPHSKEYVIEVRPDLKR